MVAHSCNPSSLGGRDGRITSAQEFETSLGNIAKSYPYKNYKISSAQWHMLVVPASWEPEVARRLDPGRWKLQ